VFKHEDKRNKIIQVPAYDIAERIPV